MEEKKEYSMIGTVTIGTDEYRGLIYEKFEAERRRDYYQNESWKKDSEINELKKQVEAMRSKIEKCEKFIKKNTVNISEDGVSIFMSLFEDE